MNEWDGYNIPKHYNSNHQKQELELIHKWRGVCSSHQEHVAWIFFKQDNSNQWEEQVQSWNLDLRLDERVTPNQCLLVLVSKLLEFDEEAWWWIQIKENDEDDKHNYHKRRENRMKSWRTLWNKKLQLMTKNEEILQIEEELHKIVMKTRSNH